MRRVVLFLLTAISCVVLCACGVLWLRSYRLADGIAWHDGAGRRREVMSYAGVVCVREVTNEPARSGTTVFQEQVPKGLTWQARHGGSMSIVWACAGFMVGAGNSGTIFTSWTYPLSNVQGTVSPVVQIGEVAAQPNSANLVEVSSTAIVTGGSTVPLTDINTTAVLQPSSFPQLTAQSIRFVPASGPWQLAVVVPYWAIALVSGLLPAYCLSKAPGLVRRRWRVKKGLCLACGYDLRASPERCPECGTPASAQG